MASGERLLAPSLRSGPVHEWLRPLYDAQGMRAADAWAIDERGVSSLRLMEAAGEALAAAVRERARPGPVRIVCGKGNNGGDGLVAARLLRDTGFDAEVLLLWPAGDLTPDAAANLERLDDGVSAAGPGGIDAALAGSGAVVDAIFGTGFAGAPRSPAAEAITAINRCDAPVVAADIASGVDASTGAAEGVAVRAAATVAFHAAKVGHRIAPGKTFAGELRVADIGIPPSAPGEPVGGEIGPDVLALAPPRTAGSTKFTSGQVVVAGGSRGLTGAVVLASSAAIRAGAGYATAAVPEELEPVFEAKLTEVMTRGCPSADGAFSAAAAAAILKAAAGAGALVLGPGIGRSVPALGVAREVAAGAPVPLVLDADGLNAHAGRLGSLRAREAPTVLTPHAGELARLLARDSEAIEGSRLESAREAAAAAGCVVLLKGDDTLVVDGSSGALAVSTLASPALATAGTGDVLAGTIGALIARGLDAFAAACCATHANARAGLIAAERAGSAEGVIATDVIAALPHGLRR